MRGSAQQHGHAKAAMIGGEKGMSAHTRRAKTVLKVRHTQKMPPLNKAREIDLIPSKEASQSSGPAARITALKSRNGPRTTSNLSGQQVQTP